jgi:peptidoglycan/xylan/chitin deacetylase (PgdA/CDA1 family)
MNRDWLIRVLSSLISPVYRGAGSVLCLHRVVPDGRASSLPENRSLELTASALRTVLKWVKKAGLEPIGIDEIPSRLAAARTPKFIAFTFDDGYRDNLTEALPIFREFGIPFSVNPTTGFVAGTEPVWWYAVEQVLHAVEQVRFKANGSAHEFAWKADADSRNAAFLTVARHLRDLDPMKRNSFVTAYCSAAGIDSLAVTRELIMDWPEVRQLSQDPLVTIAAHSGRHTDLRLFTESEAREELRESKEILEHEIGRSVRHLAYPFGGKNAVGEREFRLAGECGFKTAFTTRYGNLFAAHSRYLRALPRLTLSGNYPPIPRLEKLESGLIPAIENRFRRVVTS